MRRMSASIDLSGKVALVTGGGRGIGKAIASLLAEAGASVAIASRKVEVIGAAAREIAARGGRIAAFPCHVGRLEEIQKLVEAVRLELGPVDILVNNAATNIQVGPLLAATDAEFSKMLEINLQGALRLIRLCAPGMVERRSGSIVNISSISGLHPQEDSGYYSMTKAALLMLTRSLAAELGGSGVRVNAVAPGLVKTDFSSALWKDDQIRERRLAAQMLPGLAEPEMIAPAVLFLASDWARFITGQVLAVDGGTTAR